MATDNSRTRRRIKLIKRELQLKLIGVFLGLMLLSFLLQSLLLGFRLTDAASNLPVGGAYLMDQLPRLLVEVLLLSFGLLMPLTFFVGVLVTFRIAGPIYRFEQYLGQVASGTASEPCKIRQGDELQDLCDAINLATEPLWASKDKGSKDKVSSEKQDPRKQEPAARAVA